MKITATPHQRKALKALRSAEDRALVVMATGMGKTYLSGMFARGFNRVLFVAHRDEILNQAAAAYAMLGVEATFDSIQTISRHLNLLQPDAYDLVIVDEVHHAAAASYRKLIDHVKPKFLLGLTATPDRTDGKDIRELCGPEVYSCGLYQAIMDGALVPIRYVGIKDAVDYKGIPWRSGGFDPSELEVKLACKKRARQTLAEWKNNHGEKKQTLAFCASVVHAEFTAAYFRKRGVKCAVVTGQQTSEVRAGILADLAAHRLSVVFSIDVFSEGVDVPNVEMVMLLRPTTSEILWLQQIGRGLRQTQGKEFLTVVDLVGNHRSSDERYRWIKKHVPDRRKGPGAPGGPRGPAKWDDRCGIVFDTKLIEELSRFDRIAIREKALEMMRQGVSASQAAKKLQISGWSCAHWARAAGIQLLGYCEHVQDRRLKEKAVSRVRKGEAVSAVAEDIQIGETAVRKWCLEAGLSFTRGKVALRKQAIAAIKQGERPIRVAERLEVMLTTVTRWCREEDVDPQMWRIPEERRKQKLLSLVKGGMRICDAARKLEIPKGRAKGWCHSADVLSPSLYTEKRKKALRLLSKGLSGSEVARQIDVGPGLVQDWARKAGLKLRNPLYCAPEQKTLALRLLSTGMCAADVARKAGVSLSAAKSWAKKAGIKLNAGGGHPPDVKQRALKLMHEGMSGTEAAKLVGVTTTCCCTWAKAAGITLKPGKPTKTTRRGRHFAVPKQ